MKNLSDNWEELRLKVLGLGDSSVRKTHYPSLRKRLAELEQIRSKLQESEAFLLEAQRLSRTGSWRHDLQSGIVTTSPEMLKVFGVEPGEDYSSAEFWFNRIHPEDRKRVQAIFERSEAQKTYYEADYRIVLPDGTIKYQHSIGHPVLNESGQLVEFVGTAMDVTEQHLGKVALKNAFDEIKKSEADLLEAQRLSHTGSWRHDVLTGIVTISPEVHRIFDIRPGEDPSTAGFFFGRIHPEDRPIEAQNYERANLAKADFESDYRIVLPDGSIKHVHNVGHPVLNESGDIREFVGTVIDITERKRAEDEQRRAEAVIKEQEAELREVVDTIPAIVWSARPDGSNSYANKRFVEYCGMQPEQIAGSGWYAATHPDDLERHNAKWLACVASGESSEDELRFRRADGEYRWHLVRGVPLRDEAGKIVKWYGVVTDIEDRKRAEEARGRNEFYLSEGQRLAHMGSWGFNPAGFFDYWSEELFRIYGLDPDNGPPTLEQYLACVHPQDRAFMAETMQKMVTAGLGCDLVKRIVRPDDERSISDLSFTLSSPSIRYIRCVGIPIMKNGVLKRIIGTAMDVTEQEQLSQELQRREAYLTEAQRLSHTGSFGWRPDTGEIVWSDETYRIFEYNPAEKPTLNMVLQRIHPQDRALAQQLIEDASKSGTDFEQEYRLIVPSGAIKHLHVRAHALHDSSGNIEFVGAVTDITERKTTEDKIRRLVDAGILGIFIANLEGKIVEANQAFLQMFQYNRQDLLSGRLRWEDMTPAELRERDQRAVTEALASGFFQPYEKEFFRKDGSRLPVLLGGALFQDSNEGVSFVLDLSEQKRAEAKIREQEMELRLMLDLAPQLIAVFGPHHERIYANRMGLDYLGVSLEEWRQTRDMRRFVHPDDGDRMRAFFERALAIGSAYEVEYRVGKNDGSYRWFLARYNPLRDEQGQVTRWYVALTDIEDRKQAEDRLRSENVALREEIDKASMFEEIVGTSPALKRVLSRISKVAPSDSTVLITGETGTGKELVARAIHRRSNRASRAFVSVNCAAIPRDLIASELFGHEKGAFTGATQQRLGRFELASGGTLFLDEVGELPPETQIALLRVLQEHEFERVGGTRPIRTDVRVIAATNRELQAAISAGAFRSDLFYRLNVFPIEIPALRERKEDIRLLVEYFIDRYARKAGKNITTVDKKTLRLLESYPWPGNIRELQNVIERSVIVCESANFSVDESWLSRQPLVTDQTSQLDLSQRLAAQEKEIIETALRESGGQVFGPSGAAAKLGMPRSTLESKIRSLKINKNRFKTSG